MINQHKLACGLRIVTESMPNVRSIALNWTVGGGAATGKHDGASTLLTELVQRGVQELSARQHNDKLESLGVQKNVSCGIETFRVTGVMLGSRCVEAIPLLGAYLLQPTLPDSDLSACKSLSLQAIRSLEDSPSQRVHVALNSFHLPPPFHRSSYGDARYIESATTDQLRLHLQETFVPDGSIIVVAGNVDHQEVVDKVEDFVSVWEGKHDLPTPKKKAVRGTHWIQQDSSQVHIGIAFDGPDASDENSLLESIAMTVLGGASSSRLFTEVRQRRSLCYSVSAYYSASREHSAVRIFAGTTPDRADETIRVCLDQLEQLTQGITRDEFDRAILRMKSRTVMHGESTSARASAIWGDLYALGRVRTLADRMQELLDVCFEAVNDWLGKRKFGEVTMVTLGPTRSSVKHDLLNHRGQ